VIFGPRSAQDYHEGTKDTEKEILGASRPQSDEAIRIGEH
jgi:hypothetical protein